MVMKEKKRKNNKSLFIQIFLLVLAILLVGLIKQEILVTLFLLLVLIIIFSFLEYHKGEWILFFIGAIVGIVLELGGDLIFPLQSWADGSLFGIPLWLPILWGYSFVFIRRIGKLIVKD